MLHGRSQVNIAPRRKMPAQYVETDRLVSGLRWRDRRDHGASAIVPYQKANFKRGNRSVSR